MRSCRNTFSIKYICDFICAFSIDEQHKYIIYDLSTFAVNPYVLFSILFNYYISICEMPNIETFFGNCISSSLCSVLYFFPFKATII